MMNNFAHSHTQIHHTTPPHGVAVNMRQGRNNANLLRKIDTRSVFYEIKYG